MPSHGIVITGSLNMDFVVQVDRLPAPGETTMGANFQMIPGGKGANQACAAGRLAQGAPVKMVGCVGADPFADSLKASLEAAAVDVAAVRTTPTQPTGVALIWVERSGQNSIVVAAGANGEMTPSSVEAARGAYDGAACALFQLEIPLPAVEAALAVARAAGAQTILDPAPARPLPGALLGLVDILTPNESEACILLGREPARVTFAEAAEIADAVRGLGVGAVILKLGEQGCFYAGPEGEFAVPGFAVQAVDTTAAGDTFNAGFAVGLAEGMGVERALRFANAAAAISVTRLGAQASAPSRAEVDALVTATV